MVPCTMYQRYWATTTTSTKTTIAVYTGFLLAGRVPVGFRPVYRPRSEPQPSARDSSPVRGATHFLVRSGPVFRSPASPAPAPAPGSAHAQQPIVKKSRGWRKLWSRMKRSHSVHIPHAEDGDTGGGSRAGSISCESLGKF